MANQFLPSIPPVDAVTQGLYDGVDLSQDWAFDPTDQIFSAFELDASSPYNFNFVDAKNEPCIDPRDLQTIWVDKVGPLHTTPVVSRSVQQGQSYAQPQQYSQPQPLQPIPNQQQKKQQQPQPQQQRQQQQQQQQEQQGQALKQRNKKQEAGFPCNHPGCGKCFDRACDLRKHAQRTHTPQDQRAWKCPHQGCNKRFIWPKDVARHRRQVHGEEAVASPTEFDTVANTPTHRSESSGTSQHEKAVLERPNKKQRQLLSSIPRKFCTTLLLCRSVVLLKGLRLRRKASRSSEDEDVEVSGEENYEVTGNEDAPCEDDEDYDFQPSLIHPSTTRTVQTVHTCSTSESNPAVCAPANPPPQQPPPPQKRFVLVTCDNLHFKAVDITGATDASSVARLVKLAVGINKDAPIAVSECSPARETLKGPLLPADLMQLIAQRPESGGGAMLYYATGELLGKWQEQYLYQRSIQEALSWVFY